MQVKQYEIIDVFEKLAELGREAERTIRFAQRAQDIVIAVVKRRVLGPASPEGVYVDILNVGHDLLGRELTGDEANALHEAIIESVRVL